MDAIAAAARSAAGRRELADRGVVPELLSRLQGEEAQVVELLRALRNLCAGETLNQQAFIVGGGIQALARLVPKLLTSQHNLVDAEEFAFGDEVSSKWLVLIKVLLQLLGNVAGSGEAACDQIWARFFPVIFLDIACLCNQEVREPLTMVLYTCCRTSSRISLDISQGKGARLVALVLRDSKPDSQWLSLLIEHLCFKQNHFPSLFSSIGPSGKDEAFSSEQALLLSLMHSLAIEHPSSSSSIPRESVSYLVKTIGWTATGTSSSPGGASWPTGSAACDVLGFSLLLARELCTNEEDPSKLCQVFVAEGLVRLCLDLLRALGPPEVVKKALQQQQQQEEAAVAAAAAAKTSTLGLEATSRYPTQNLYEGYRRDIVAVIANVCFRNRRAQDEVRENDGLLLLLQQCVIDDKNPYLREWGLWAIRNVTEGNARNVEELASLELKKPVDTEVVLKAGLKLKMDASSGRPKLVNTTADK